MTAMHNLPLNPCTQLLIKQQDYFSQGLALIQPPLDVGLADVFPIIRAIYGYDFRLNTFIQSCTAATACALNNEDTAIAVQVAASFSNPMPEQDYLMFWPKAKQQGMMMLANWLPLVPAGRLYVIGENRSGLKAVMKQLPIQGIDCEKISSARHALLVKVEHTPDHNAFCLEDWAERFEVAQTLATQNAAPLEITSYPGVFSHGRLDKGTALLLAHLPDLTGLKVVDLGCGSGVIAATIAQRYPEQEVVASDVNKLALAACAQTAERNHLTRLSTLASDGWTQLLRQHFDFAITNPPFHQGLRTEYDTTRLWLSQAPQWLTKKGRLMLVANDFLDYESVLRSYFSQVSTLVRQGGFKLLYARL